MSNSSVFLQILGASTDAVEFTAAISPDAAPLQMGQEAPPVLLFWLSQLVDREAATLGLGMTDDALAALAERIVAGVDLLGVDDRTRACRPGLAARIRESVSQPLALAALGARAHYRVRLRGVDVDGVQVGRAGFVTDIGTLPPPVPRSAPELPPYPTIEGALAVPFELAGALERVRDRVAEAIGVCAWPGGAPWHDAVNDALRTVWHRDRSALRSDFDVEGVPFSLALELRSEHPAPAARADDLVLGFFFDTFDLGPAYDLVFHPSTENPPDDLSDVPGATQQIMAALAEAHARVAREGAADIDLRLSGTHGTTLIKRRAARRSA